MIRPISLFSSGVFNYTRSTATICNLQSFRFAPYHVMQRPSVKYFFEFDVNSTNGYPKVLSFYNTINKTHCKFYSNCSINTSGTCRTHMRTIATHSSKTTKSKPNQLTHFWAIRIDNQQLREQLIEIQEKLFINVEKSAELEYLLGSKINPSRFHVTLGLFSIDSKISVNSNDKYSDPDSITTKQSTSDCDYDSKIETAESALVEALSNEKIEMKINDKDCVNSENDNMNDILQMKFDRIDCFSNKRNKNEKNVIFMSLNESSIDLIKKLYNKIENVTVKNGLVLNESVDKFKPHLTLAKMSQIRKRNSNQKKYFDQTVTKQIQTVQVDNTFPVQSISNIELCSLKSNTKSKDGYYRVLCKIPVVVELKS